MALFLFIHLGPCRIVRNNAYFLSDCRCDSFFGDLHAIIQAFYRSQYAVAFILSRCLPRRSLSFLFLHHFTQISLCSLGLVPAKTTQVRLLTPRSSLGMRRPLPSSRSRRTRELILKLLSGPDSDRPACNRAVSNRIASTYFENAPAVSVEACLVQRAVAAQPYNHPLIGAPSPILSFACSAFTFIRARLDHVYYAPHLPSLAESVVELIVAAQKSKICQVSDNGTHSHALEEVYPGIALWADDVRPADRDPDVG
jgi:hypothetical protein